MRARPTEPALLRSPPLVMALAAFLCFLWCPPAGAAQLRVGTVCWAGFSGLNVADAKGFWSQQGLEVQVTVYRTNQEVNDALLQGHVDLALDMIGSWMGYYQAGVDIVVLAETDWSQGGDKILARTDFDPGDLRGQTVGIYLNKPSVTFFLDRFLRSQHLAYSDVKVVEADTQALTDRFIEGKFPVIVNYDPQSLRAVRLGNGRVYATSASYPGVIPEGFGALRERVKQFPPGHLAKFWKGFLQAVTWLQAPENWREYQRILNERTFPFDPDFSESDLRAMVDSVSMHSSTKLLERNSPRGGLERYMEDLSAFLLRTGQLRRPMEEGAVLATESFVAALREFDR